MIKPTINEPQNFLKSKNRKYDIFPLMTLSIFVIMVILGASGVPINDFVYIGFNGLLVCVTVKYTFITKDILEDGKKKREIEFIQRKLEYFYYPLLRTIEKAEREAQLVFEDLAYEEYENNESHNYRFYCLQYISDALKNNIEELYKYKYLSTVPIREKFQEIELYLENTPFKFEGQEYADHEYLNDKQEQIDDKIQSLNEDLKSEIENLNNKLFYLIN